MSADIGQPPPQNIEAEQSVLGACLLAAGGFRDARRVLSDDDWYRPAHALIWSAVCDLEARGVRAEPVAVAAELSRRGDIAKAGGHAYLHTLISDVPVAVQAGYWAELVAERAVLRRLVEAGTRIAQLGYQAAGGDGFEGTVDDVLGRARDELAVVRGVESAGERPDVGIIDMLDEKLPDRPLIPGLLDESERLIVTAGEGLGKSTWLRQVVVCSPAGLHPFTHEPIEPVTAMAIDYENPKKLNQRRYGPLVASALECSGMTETELNRRLRVVLQPRGVNLLNRSELAKVLRLVDRVKPQLLMIGPIYRLYKGDANAEGPAREVSDALDEIREAAGECTMLMEHHPAKGRDATGRRNLEPVGSSVWMRWTDFGYGIRLEEGSDLSARAVTFEPWKGPRDERDWPENMISGFAIGEPWPWKQVDRRALFRPEPPDEPDWSQDY